MTAPPNESSAGLVERLGSIVTEILLAHGDGFYEDGLEHAATINEAMRALASPSLAEPTRDVNVLADALHEMLPALAPGYAAIVEDAEHVIRQECAHLPALADKDKNAINMLCAVLTRNGVATGHGDTLQSVLSELDAHLSRQPAPRSGMDGRKPLTEDESCIWIRRAYGDHEKEGVYHTACGNKHDDSPNDISYFMSARCRCQRKIDLQCFDSQAEHDEWQAAHGVRE